MNPNFASNSARRAQFGPPAHSSNRLQSTATHSSVPGPIRVILWVWALMFLNYFIGPNEFPFPSLGSVFLIFFAILFFVGGSMFGAGNVVQSPEQLAKLAGRSAESWRGVVMIGSWISALGAGASVLINIRAGKSLAMTLYNTELVRQQVIEDLGPVSVVTNALAFMSFSWLIITIMLCRYSGGVKRNKIALAGSICGVVGVLMIYVLNVNRTAFLVLIEFLILYIGVIENGSLRGALRRVSRQSVAIGFAVMMICCSYFLFISIARADRGENERFVAEYMTLKYRIPFLEQWNYDSTCGLYKLQWYASHQIRNLDQILLSGDMPIVKADGRLFFEWPINQIARFHPAWQTRTTDALEELSSHILRAGAYDWQWCTALLIFCFDFGIVGGLALVFLMGLLIGTSYRIFLSQGSMMSALICFWWGSIAMLLFLNFPIDNFIQTNIFAVLVFKAYFWLIGRQSL